MEITTPIYQYDSKNEKWIRTITYMNEHHMLYHGQESHFPLELYDETLQGIDPFDNSLSDEIKQSIITECLKNPVYFMRECVKNKDGQYLRLNVAVIAVLKCIVNHSNIYLNIPYYDQYDFLVQATIIAVTGLFKTSNRVAINNYNWDNELVVLPDYLNIVFHCDVSDYNAREDSNDKAVYFLNEFDINSIEYKYVDQLVSKQAAYAGMFSFPMVILTNFQESYIPKLRCVTYDNCYSADNCEFRMPDNHITLRINYDIIEMEINIRDSYKLVNEKIERESNHQLTTLEHIKLFAKYVLLQNYDDHDVLQKLYINRIYADLSNGF